MKKKIERNRPVATLMKEDTGHDKVKSSAARTELHRRFDYLDYDIQKKILLAHLDSTKNDRQWAYPRLLDYWDASFIAPVLNIWDKYHETRCSWAIVQHFPKEYIIEHIEELASIERNYYYICLRFGGDIDFVIDKKRLLPFDLIRVACKTGMPISHDEAMWSVFSIIEQACNDTDYIGSFAEGYVFFSPGNDRFTRFSLDNISNLEYAYYYLSKMELTSVTEEIDRWIETVNGALSKDVEWINLNKEVLSDSSFNYNTEKIVTRLLYDQIPTRYKQRELAPKTFRFYPTYNNESQNKEGFKTALDDLIDKFDLTVDDAPF